MHTDTDHSAAEHTDAPAAANDRAQGTAKGARPDILGWGADLDPAMRPAYPKERMPPRLDHPPPSLPPQVQRVEVLHSTERPGLTPVFGSTLPPSGLSGMLRRHAFRHSENDLRHWLTLLLADRVNVVEGLLQDLRSGHLPHLYAEMGGRAELRHNPRGAATRALTLVAAAGLLIWMARRRR